MRLLDDYFALQKQIYAHFGYREDWRVIPLDDAREYFWKIEGEGPGEVKFAKTEQELADETGNYYSNEIYTHRHLSTWVYRAADYTMICVDTHTDGNKFLQIFDNAKERQCLQTEDDMPGSNDQFGVAVMARGKVVAWFAEFDEEARDWCTYNHFGEWLTWRAKEPEMVPLTDEEYAKVTAEAAELSAVLNEPGPDDAEPDTLQEIEGDSDDNS